MSLTAKLVAVLVLALAVLAGWHRLTVHYERIGYDRAQAEYQAAAEKQREANRGRSRQAEEHESQQAAVRDRFITKTITEVRYVTQALAACPVPDAARQLLNDAAECARSDRSAACGAGE